MEGGHWRLEPDHVNTDTNTAEPCHQEVLVVGAGAHRAVLNKVEVSANQEKQSHSCLQELIPNLRCSLSLVS